MVCVCFVLVGTCACIMVEKGEFFSLLRVRLYEVVFGVSLGSLSAGD